MNTPSTINALVVVLAAVIPAGLSLVGTIVGRDRQPREFKNLLALSAASKDLTPESPEKLAVGELIVTLANDIARRTRDRKPLNPTNVGLTIALSASGGVGSYLLYLWAIGGGGALAWTLFGVVALITLLLGAGGIGTIRNPPGS
jgi:hypothetical protein